MLFQAEGESRYVVCGCPPPWNRGLISSTKFKFAACCPMSDVAAYTNSNTLCHIVYSYNLCGTVIYNFIRPFFCSRMPCLLTTTKATSTINQLWLCSRALVQINWNLCITRFFIMYESRLQTLPLFNFNFKCIHLFTIWTRTEKAQEWELCTTKEDIIVVKNIVCIIY